MCSDIAIEVSGVGKEFHLNLAPTKHLWKLLSKSKVKSEIPFKALDDISFVVNRGETLGIVGRNGAGKSTLLQVICGTLYPSKGKVALHGKLAALLELGAGFNPEFTGRENVYLSASIYGLSSKEIDKRYLDIVSFAEIGGFIDQPV